MLLRLSAPAVLVASLALALPPFASADILGGVQQPFTLSISPADPTPYGVVTILPVSGQIDVTNGTMTISAGGAQVASGNASSVSVRLGAPGVPVPVVARLVTARGAYSVRVTLTPQDVVLVAEPLSSAPPLYPGKPLVPLGGNVRMVAVAEMRTATGKQLEPDTLAYMWSVDGAEQQAASGIGEKAMLVDSPLQYRSRSVEVVVTSPDGTLVGSASIDLTATDPSVRIYERDPLLGIRFERALTTSYAMFAKKSNIYS